VGGGGYLRREGKEVVGGGRDNGFEPLRDFFVGFVEVGFGDA
jgi:hypothetical protein